MDRIYHGDAMDFMKRSGGDFADVILTSPPYNTSRPGHSDRFNKRYDSFVDGLADDDYIGWTVDLFRQFDRVLKPDGVVLYNLSYSSENTTLMFLTVAEIARRSGFTIADVIVWKKKSAIPNNRSPNKLTRICEFVFVFCRESEFRTFRSNKAVISLSKKGQKNYENVPNFIEARNNDGPTPLNKATFSTEFAEKLLRIYAPPGGTVFDPFMGTGTTAVAAMKLGLDAIGCELSRAQVDYANERIAQYSEQGVIHFE